MIEPLLAGLATATILLTLGKRVVAPSSHTRKLGAAYVPPKLVPASYEVAASSYEVAASSYEVAASSYEVARPYQKLEAAQYQPEAGGRYQPSGDFPEPYPLHWPQIDRYHTANVTALAGETTSLNCRVHSLGNRSVSWLKRDKIHLLTVGRYTYTSDLRFEGKHIAGSLDWTLLLREATPLDSGEYECQVSTTPPIAVTVFLNVKDSKTAILGAPEVYVQVGSTINLTCVVSNMARPPSRVDWEKDGQVLSYLGPRPGVSLVTDKAEITVVSLIMAEARLNDSGIYFCQPFSRNLTEELPVANISVHVIKGANIDQLSGVGRLDTLSSALLLTICVVIGMDPTNIGMLWLLRPYGGRRLSNFVWF